MASRRTAYVWDELCFWHDPGNYALMAKPGGYIEPYGRHIENPDPKRRMHQLLLRSGLLSEFTVLPARDATVDELASLHTREYIARVRQTAQAGGGELGVGAPITSNGWGAALRSAGAALAATDAIFSGAANVAYALTRPPGHHAEPHRGMGFCVFANAALAMQHAIDRWGVRRGAVVDWDVHFGNGTYACFADRSDVLAISIHQQAGYLQVSGEADEIGSGDGLGYSMNIPLAAGSGFGAYREAFERLIGPALEAFKPEFIVVPSGYDAGRFDPLGRMLLDDVAFRWMTDFIVDIARRHANSRLLLVHEGGYCPVSVPFWGLATLESLSGHQTDVTCPFTLMPDKVRGLELQPDQRRLVTELDTWFQDVRQRHWA
jgi:acetoin utilization deacetylase AcuC-like enzyme